MLICDRQPNYNMPVDYSSVYAGSNQYRYAACLRIFDDHI
jgi:hypothetical protein